MRDMKDKAMLNDSLANHGYEFKDLSGDDLAKEHIRHMIGGKSNDAVNEHIYEIIFPERPKALQDFLVTMGDTWNISLFHYRGQGLDTGSVVVGFEAESPELLTAQLKKTGYSYAEITSVSASLFL